MTFSQLLQKNIAFISLGCDKNRVDLENIIGQVNAVGFNITQINQANIVVINTCSFILDARKESIENILEMANLKNNGRLEKIIVTGCLNQMGYEDLQTSLPEVDLFIKIKDNENFVHLLANLYNVSIPSDFSLLLKNQFRVLTTPKHYAYLKISDGCNNFCSYCTIPYIRGRFKSEPIEKLVSEAKILADGGVTEIILVAQDVTRYGEDIYKEKSLVKLIKELSKIEKIKWIRLLYCYPKQINDDLINEIATNPKVCKYIDLPFQHIETDILKAMNRKETKEEIIDLINKLKTKIPDVAIRSTFILGFPGETDQHFNALCEFISTYKLNNVGFFKYSKEEGTLAAKMKNQIPQKIKNSRLKTISQLQFKCVIENANKVLNKTFEVVVDSIQEDMAICRSQYLCPEVDGVIMVKHNNIMQVGQYYNIKINKIKNYDLIGELLWIYQIDYH